MVMGQAVDSASIIGKSIRAGNFVYSQFDGSKVVSEYDFPNNLVVAQYDFPYRMNWYDAIIACAALGKGWRLPTKEQLNSLYKNKQKISDFPSIYYWSSTEVDCEDAWVQNVYEGGLIKQDKKDGNTVRAIRAF